MEAVALASTFATLIGVSMQLYGTCKYYIDAARGDCPNDLRLIMIETSSLSATLGVVKDLIELRDIQDEDAMRLKRQIGKPVEDCKKCIEELIKLVPKPLAREGDDPLKKREKAKIIMNAIVWGTSGKKGTCDTLLQHLRTHKATLSLGLTTELSHNVNKIGSDVAEIKTTVNTMQAELDHAQRGKVYKWLEKVNPSTNHNNAGQLHERETGQWLARADEWKAWMNGGPKSRFIWLHGIPGAGKTVLAYTMVEQVKSVTKADKKQAIAYYYCYHGRNKDETVPFLTWILGQLCRASDYIPVILSNLHGSGCEPNIKDLLDCVEAVLTQFTAAYAVVDAVDESNPRANLLKVLSTLGSDPRFGKLRLAITSREYPDIETAFKPRSVAMSMSNLGVMEDIRKYVTSKLQDERYEAWGKALRDEVATLLPQKARGMFRYAACQLEILAECSSVGEVRKELTHLPATLDETYERILLNIDSKHRGDATRALALILGSQEHTGPILAQTLVSAVVNYGGNTGTKSFCTIDTLRKHCVCLIKVRSDSTVDLAHYTVREFLQSSRLQKKLPDFALPETKVDEIFCNTVMSTAVQFSGTPDIRRIAEDSNGDPTDYRLYALRRTRMAMFWNRDTLLRTSDNKRLVTKLLNPYESSFRGLQLLGSEGHSDESNEMLFEWLPKFNDSADATEKAAAHLTMLASFEKPDLIKEFLGAKSEQQKAALFGTEMQVLFPAEWKLYRQRGTYDPKRIGTTVLGFYSEGLKRGYDTSAKVKMLRTAFASYIRESPKPSDANTSALRNVAPSGNRIPPALHSGTPASTSKVSANSSRETSSLGANALKSSNVKPHAQPNPSSNSSSSTPTLKPQMHSQPRDLHPQIQSHSQIQSQSQSHAQSQSQSPNPRQSQSQGQKQQTPLARPSSAHVQNNVSSLTNNNASSATSNTSGRPVQAQGTTASGPNNASQGAHGGGVPGGTGVAR